MARSVLDISASSHHLFRALGNKKSDSVRRLGRTYLLRQTMAAAERSLDESRFMRVHRSTIVNRRLIKERRCGGVLVLQSGRTVTVSRAYRDQLRH